VKIEYLFLDPDDRIIDGGVADAETAAEEVRKFVINHGTDPHGEGSQALPGKIEFKPVKEG
jgi:hypothetical protein